MLLLVLLPGCPAPYTGDDTPTDRIVDSGDTDADADGDADTDTDTGLTPAEDDARVRALTGLPEGDDPAGTPLLVRIDYVVDGDTVYCTPDGTSDSLKVRLIGVDTPEIAHDDPAECYGNEAWAFSEAALTDRLAWLTYDADEFDDYGRTLAYLFRDADEAGFFNRRLAREGYATPLDIAPDDTYAPEIQADADAARAEGLGLWSACP